MVHRDIKPANILLDAGHALVADFGIARAIGRGADLSTGHIIGTPAYMSPEQIDGSRYLDGRSDIYSLGCVLFEMLVGEPPFRGSTLTAVIANRLSTPGPVAAGASASWFPRRWTAAVRKAMATLPADRFTTAAPVRRGAGHLRHRGHRGGRGAGDGEGGSAAAKSVAVLPFENMSTDPENEYFSDGITDDIIAQLSKISALKVISRTSSMQYKKTTKKIATIAEELGRRGDPRGQRPPGRPAGADRGAPGRSRTEKHLWGETFDRQLTDIFEVQSEVAQQITGALSVALSPEEKQRVEKKATERRRRVQPVSAGPLPRQQVVRGGRPQGHRVLPGAPSPRIPGYAVAYAGLADAYELLSIGFSSKPPVEYLAQAKAMALKALEMDDTPRRGAHLAGVRPLARRSRLVRRGAGVQARARAQVELRHGPRVVRRVSWPRWAGTTRRSRRSSRPSSSTRSPSR